MNYSEYRKDAIEDGLKYQDFVVDRCWDMLGLAIVQYVSRNSQYSAGESRTGVEIKFDRKYAETGNLWIEIAEKAQPRNGKFAPSGVRRSDNTWLYIIGNYDRIFIFSKKQLQELADSDQFEIRENSTNTSLGFLLKGKSGHPEKYAIKILEVARDTGGR